MMDVLKQRLPVPVVILRWIGSIAIAVACGTVSYAWLASDARNDKRYVQIEAYRYDRERDKEMRDLVSGQINTRLAGQDKKLDEISGDVKTLLRESRTR